MLGRTADLERAVGATGGAGRACEAVVSVAVRSASLVSVRGQTGWFGGVGRSQWGWGRVWSRGYVLLGVLVCLTGFDVDAVGFLARVSGVQRGLVLGDPGGHGGNAEEVIITGAELWALEDIVQFRIHQGCNMVVRG